MSFLTQDIKGGKAHLTMYRAPHNALTIPFMQELAAAFRQFREMNETSRPRVIFLTSAIEGMFCNGIDPDSFLPSDQLGREEHFRTLLAMMTEILSCPVPVMAVVSGPAMAGGAVLAMLADFILMHRNLGKLSFSEAKVGVPIPAPIFKLCQQKISGALIPELLLLGKNYDGPTALAAGLVQGLYEGEQEEGAWLESLSGRIQRIHPRVWEVSLKNARQPILASLRDFEADFAMDLAPFLTDEFLGKGLRAIQQGKAPVF